MREFLISFFYVFLSHSLLEEASGSSASSDIDNPEGEIREAIQKIKDYVLRHFTTAILR